MGREGWTTAGVIGLGIFGGWAFGALAGAWGLGSTAAQVMTGLGYMGGSFLGNMLFAKEGKTDMPPMANYPIQQTTKGPPLPINYGTNRMAGNVVWMSDVTVYESEIDTGGGKGGADAPTQTMYRRSFLICLCEGQCTVNRIWANNKEITTGIAYSRSAASYSPDKNPTANVSNRQEITVFGGDGENEGLSDLVGELYATYKWDCCVFFSNYDLGSTDSLPNFTFEVSSIQEIFEDMTWTNKGLLGTETLPKPIVSLTGGYALAGGYTTGKVYRTTDYGATWEEVEDFGASTHVYAFAYLGSDTVLAGVFKSGDWKRVYRSVDNGLTWGNLSTPPLGGVIETLVNVGSGIILGVIDSPNYLIRSVDSGASWSYLDFINADMYGLVYLGSGIAVGVDVTGHVWRSTDYGATWSDLGAIAGDVDWVQTVTYAGSGVVLAGGYNTAHDGVIWRSTDYGVTWSQAKQFENGEWVLALENIGGGLVVAGTKPIVYRSDDYGVTWTVLEELDGEVSADTITYLGNDVGVVGTGDTGNVYQAAGRQWGSDSNASFMVNDLLTNARYGAKMPAWLLNTASFTEQRLYWTSQGFGISMVIDRSRFVMEWVTYILSHVGGFIYRQGDQLYLGAWKAENPVGTITRDDLAVDDEDNAIPIQMAKRKYSETFNEVEVQWQNRAATYENAIAKATDDVDIRHSGKRRKRSVELMGIKTQAMAELMKWRLLIDSLYRFTTYAFRLGPKHQDIKAGRVYSLSDGFKVSDARVRITKIVESERAGEIEIEAVDDISDIYPDLSGWNTTATTGRTADTVVTADDLAEPITAYREDWEARQLHLSFAPQSAYTQGFLIFVSRDDATYEYAGRAILAGITGGMANVAGSTLSALDAAVAPTWRGDESVLVDVGTVGDLATDITDEQFFGNLKLAKIGSEIIAYRTCEETETEGQWQITGLIRGLYQTDPVAHAVGTTFATLNVDFTYTFEESDIGSTIYVKAIPYWLNIGPDMSDITATAITVMGHLVRPFQVGLPRLTSDENDEGAAFTEFDTSSFGLYWNLSSRTVGFNLGGMDGGDTWKWGDDEGDLVSQGGIPYDAYIEDADLVALDLVFRESDGTLIGQRSIAVASTESISYVSDLGSNNEAKIEVWARYALRAIREESILVTTDGVD